MDFIGINTLDELVKLAIITEDTFLKTEDFELSDILHPKTRKILNKAITPYTTSSETKNKYFDDVPMTELKDALERNGYFVLQEDKTPWEGMILGDEGHQTFKLGVKQLIKDGQPVEGMYKEVKNAMLVLSWYRMPSGKYEINAYIS